VNYRSQQEASHEHREDEGTLQVFSVQALEKALSSEGCLICAALVWFEWKSVHSFLYEGMMFPHVRRQFLDRGGFCAFHFEIAKQIERESWQAGGIGMAILCEDLIKRGMLAITKIANGADDKRLRQQQNSGAVELRSPGALCMFCADKKEKERALLGVLEEVHGELKFRVALENPGLCLRHGQLAVAAWKQRAARDWIAEIMQNRMQELADDLEEYVRKHDHQRRAEAPGREHDSVERAQELILGTRMRMGNQT
jgi:hypothetical protein